MHFNKILPMILVSILASSFIYVQVNDNYLVSSNLINSSNINDWTILIYAKLYHSKSVQAICSDTVMECFKPIGDYLIDNIFDVSGANYTLEVFFNELSHGGEDFGSRFTMLFQTSGAFVGITVVYMVFLIVMYAKNHNYWVHWLLSYILFLIIIYSILGSFIKNVDNLTAYGFHSGANLCGAHNNEISTNCLTCFNNLDCINKMVELWVQPNVNKIIVNQINQFEYDSHVGIILLALLSASMVVHMIINVYLEIKVTYDQIP